MKVKVPGKIIITVEADSPKALEKLLDQALFELKLESMDNDGYQQALSKSSKGEQAGSMGNYRFDFTASEIEWDDPF
ncbi:MULTISPECIES: hypothetical protein [Pseudomonas]|uniref:hypothetical protein n=1 Tax=Pseudomonas TaxID=286 RepID=UPI000D8922FA|nr:MULTISPECIES: hypothetical protein [Pseudomonas]MBP2085313.1 hypothetical protein [Pseudomonas sp. PvP089]MBP2088985.1 hypothetical protein [Pseudomonas sp. PvP088]MBP2224852.1 hypothetical protein [Pseudomonas putida]PYG97028.1 hypothetical protein CVV67_29740 [Arthrobacter stackebrandtii]